MFAAANVEKVLRHLYRLGLARAEAEDLAQEALLIAWRRRAELDPTRSLDGWLYGITRNVHRNHTRGVRRDPVRPTDDPPDAHADGLDLADGLALRAAVAELPEGQQDVVILHDLEGHTLAEAAAIMEARPDTAKDWLRRGRATLQARLGDRLEPAMARDRSRAERFAAASAAGVLAAVLASVVDAGTAAAATGAAATAGGPAGPPAASAQIAAGTGTWIGKAIIGAALFASGVGVGVIVQRARPSAAVGERPAPPPPPALIAEVSAVADARPAPVALDAAAGAPLVPTPIDAGPHRDADAIGGGDAAGVAPGPARDAAPPDDRSTPPGTHPEAALIEHARNALRRGTPDEAIRVLMQHERRFKDGQLAEERDIYIVEAYLAAGQLALAARRLEAYQAAYPRGAHAVRAERAARQLATALAGSATGAAPTAR